jgi:three-Cys-motif partner protein
MDMADKLLENVSSVSSRVDRFDMVFIENDSENFENLKSNVSKKKQEVDPRIRPKCIPDKFQDWAQDFINDHQRLIPPPALIFIDPFGYGSIPFDLISRLFQLRSRSLELLITFMAGKMAQWMEDENHQKAIDQALGYGGWRKDVSPDLGKDKRAQMFSEVYQEQLETDANANYTLPFEMVEESKRQICYYLIHVTNHFEGLKVMKENMFNAGADDEYAYLGPDHSAYDDEQLSFSEFGETDNFEKRIEEFAEELYEQYIGESILFRDLLKQTLDENVFITTHYRDAFDYLAERKNLEVNHRPHDGGNKSYGYGLGDELKFVDNVSLDDFS